MLVCTHLRKAVSEVQVGLDGEGESKGGSKAVLGCDSMIQLFWGIWESTGVNLEEDILQLLSSPQPMSLFSLFIHSSFL